MKRSNKKGFTIVELVIVIAIIAILAAVLIPTFASLIQKANTSADIQAVRQMNTALALLDATDKPEDINAAIMALSEVKISLENYKPLTSGMQFYWVKDINRVVYADEDFKVSYPEEYKTLTKVAGNWYSLNGEIKFEEYTISNNEVTMSSAGQLASFINDYNKGVGETKSVTKITLSDDIDLAGSSYKFVGDKTNGFTGTMEIDGNGKTVYGFRDDNNTIFGSGEFATKGYGYGLFYRIGTGANVTIKNVTFSGMSVSDSSNLNTGTLGLIAGYMYGTLTLENVNIENSSVSGSQKVGAIAGRVDGTLIMKNVTLKNVNVFGEYEVAKLVGYVPGIIEFENVKATENVNVKFRDTFNYKSEGYTRVSNDKMAVAINATLSENSYYMAESELWNGSYYTWSGVTDEYFWKLVDSSVRQITIDEKPHYWYACPTSENITK